MKNEIKIFQISLKNKLIIGFGFLFFMIILLWIIGGYFIYNLSNRSAAMLSENYQTVESAKFLIQAIDEIKNQQTGYFFSSPEHIDDIAYNYNLGLFQDNLIAVRNNITEKGERELIGQLELSYNEYLNIFNRNKRDYLSDKKTFFTEIIPVYTKTRNLIVELSDLNMNAISYKNNLLKITASKAFVLISLIGTICFIISALFFFRYPRNISRPIIQLTNGIKEIANRNYEQKLHIKSHDELGQLAEAFNTMTAKLNEYEHSSLSELLFEKKRIDTIINNMKDPIIGLNEKKEIIFSNALACEILNLQSSDLIGKYAPDIAGTNEIFMQIVVDIITGEHTKKKEFSPLKIYTNGKPLYYTKEILDVALSKTGESQPVNVGVVIVLKNITRFLEQDEAKTNFIATISHELKTPLSALKLNLKLLDDDRIGNLNEEQKNIVATLKQETNKMLAITSELLNMAQIETGNIQIDLQPVAPVQIIDYIKETSFNQAKSKNIKIEFNISPDLPMIYSDPEKTTWVLMNLINNAIQYSENESIINIEVQLTNNYVQFKVQDSGKGIEEQYINKVFEKFFRIPGSSQKGTGLGLAISKEFISKQHGKIWVSSKLGEGSSFYFTLPVY